MPGGDPEPVLTLRVAGREVVADGVVRLDLADPAGGELPDWSPGAHVDLLLPGEMVRQYSLCGPRENRRGWTVAVLREPAGRGGSAWVHDSLREGDEVRVRGPRNHFRFEPGASVVFIAGGIGITPLLPMIAEAEQAGVSWRLHYGGRSLATMAFTRDLLARYGDERVRVCPEDETGLLDVPGILGVPQPGTSIYCCGPEPLLKAVENQCAAWPAGALRTERFAPGELAAPVRTDAFEVQIGEDGEVLTVPPDRSILSVVDEAGVPVLSSCQEGTCGTCETFVLDGVPDHRDHVLSESERDRGDVMMICVSRSSTPRLVLDL